jgi:hypothetical protein
VLRQPATLIGPQWIDGSVQILVALPASQHDMRMGTGDAALFGARAAVPPARELLPALSECPETNLAAGRQTASARWAATSRPVSGVGGDLSPALTRTGLADPVIRGMRSATTPIEGGAYEERPATSIDVDAAALFGPPDRQSARTQSDSLLSRERGDIRDDLMQTSWPYWAPPTSAPPWPRG